MSLSWLPGTANIFLHRISRRSSTALAWADAEVPEKVQDVVCFDEAVRPFDDCPIHLLDGVERTITIPNDVLVPKVKIGCEPDVGHRDSSLSLGAKNEYVTGGVAMGKTICMEPRGPCIDCRRDESGRVSSGLCVCQQN